MLARRIASLVVLLAAVVAPARAAETVGSVTDGHDTVTWTGRGWTTSDAPIPDEAFVSVDLTDGYWSSHEGGVEFAIRWTSEYNVLDLYVTAPDGTLYSAIGFPTSAESVTVPSASDGVYHLVIVPSAIQVDQPPFDGLAQLELKTAQTGALVPDLAPLAPKEFRIETGVYSFAPIYQGFTGGCYPEELAENDGLTKCLRFDSAVSNIGDGPFELHLDVLDTATNPQVYQDIYDRDGHTVGSPQPVGEFTYHATHGHFHYKNFARYELFNVNGDGSRGGLAATSRKADFCMIDTRALWWGLKGNGARNHHFPQCNVPAGDNAAPTQMRQGIDVGWADVYTWDLPGQYIDVSSVADGVYDVVVTVNPSDVLTELSLANNASFTRIRIDGTAVTEL